MVVLALSGDTQVTGWSVGPQAGGATSSLYAQLNAGKRLHSPARVRETRHTVIIMSDDQRHDDLVATVAALWPYRPSEKCLQALWDEGITTGVWYKLHGTTFGPCWPSRTELDTSLWAPNHGNTALVATSSIGSYEDTWVAGIKKTLVNLGRAVAQWCGPWGMDLGYMAGYTRKRRTGAQQLADAGGGSLFGTAGFLRDADDDLQAFSGSWYQQFAAEATAQSNAGIAVAQIMKHNNGTSAGDPVPAGCTYMRRLIDSGGEVSQFAYDVQTYIGANPFNGPGVSAPATVNFVYNVGNFTAATWSAGTVFGTCSAAHKLSVGDEVTISGCSVTGYNGTFTVTALGDAVGASPTTKFQYALVANPGAAVTSTNGVVRNRTNYPTQRTARWFKEFAAALRDCDAFVAKLSPRPPHDNAGAYGSTVEDKWSGAVDPLQATPGGSLAADYVQQNAVGYCSTSGSQSAYEARNEMLASEGDMIREIADYCNARYGPDGWQLVYTSDQGEQLAEQNTWGQGGVKTAIWRGSEGAPLVLRGFSTLTGSPGATSLYPTRHADIIPTILWEFGWTDHHWIGNSGAGTSAPTRDGRALQAENDTRMLPVWGDYKSSSDQSGGGGFYGKKANPRKYVTLNNIKSSGLFWFPLVDYEAASTTPTSGEQDTYYAALQNIQDARFNPATETHPAHTLVSP